MNRTVARTIEMLEIISKHPKGITFSELVLEMGIPKTSGFDILKTLEHLNMVTILDHRLSNYTISAKAFSIGNKYIQRDNLIEISKPYLIDVGNRLGKTMFLAKEVNGKILYIYKHEPENTIITTAHPGTTKYMHCAALGKAILAMSDDSKEKVNKLTLHKITERTITNKNILLKELDNIRKLGYSIDDREFQDHMFCIGAPLYNYENKVIAAISISGLYKENIDVKTEGKILKEAAKEISKKLGYNG